MRDKLCGSIREAIERVGLKDGMTISFHHHLRNGDHVVNMVVDTIAEMGIRDITLSCTSLFDCHIPLYRHIQSGVISHIETNYMTGGFGRAISEGILDAPVIFRSHGTRPSDIVHGRHHIDVAFIAAPTSDNAGNCTGKLGKSACGPLSYSVQDAMYADKSVVITDNLVPYPLGDRSISEVYVDCVVPVESIGDPAGIVSGVIRMTKDPIALKIADYAAQAIAASGLLVDGFAFQTGGGGASLATADYLHRIMRERGVVGSFALGGITSYIVDMLHDGCFRALMDAQCFDQAAINSLRDDPNHFEITTEHYASPTAKSTVASHLDVSIVGATEIDTDFNVNVHTDSTGYIIGGSGGHTDITHFAKTAIVVAPLSRARTPIVVDKVTTLSTPGSSIDLLVTQYGIAVNPARQDLAERLTAAHLPVRDIHELRELAVSINGPTQPRRRVSDRVVAKVLGLDSSVQDVIYAVK